MPISFISRIGRVAKIANTPTITIAALVTVPSVAGHPALRPAQLRTPAVHAASPVRRAVGVALATLADERAVTAYSGMTGTIDALRGGTYVVGPNRVRFVAVRVVTDAVAYGTLNISRRSSRAQLCRARGSRCASWQGRRESPARSGADTWT
jgi:hypothetical protein